MGAGVAPAPCVTRTEVGSPRFPSALTTKGAFARGQHGRMKGGESRPDHGDESLRFGPTSRSGVETPQVERRERACRRKARGRFAGCPDTAPFALLPHVVREGMTRTPRDKQWGR